MVEYYHNIKQELERIPLLGFPWPVIAYLCFSTAKLPEMQLQCRFSCLPSGKLGTIRLTYAGGPRARVYRN
jgi:hypothetical protein